MADWEKTGKKMEAAGKNMQQLGCLLTMIITVPILLIAFLGPLGIAISVIFVVLGIAGYVKKKKDDKEKREAEEYGNY